MESRLKKKKKREPRGNTEAYESVVKCNTKGLKSHTICVCINVCLVSNVYLN